MAAPTQQEIDRLINAVDRAQKDSDYVDAIKMDVQNIDGTRYRFRLSEAEPER